MITLQSVINILSITGYILGWIFIVKISNNVTNRYTKTRDMILTVIFALACMFLFFYTLP